LKANKKTLRQMKLKSERDCFCLDHETIVFGKEAAANIPYITLHQFTFKDNFILHTHSIGRFMFMFCQRGKRENLTQPFTSCNPRSLQAF